MGGYLVSFSVYTFAMVGFLFLAVFVYRKTNVGANAKSKTGGMQIEESLNLSPRKSLHVVRVNDEKFLIAADLERTEFLAKLDNNTTISNEIQFPKTIVNQSKLVDNSNVTSILASKLKKEPVSAVQGNVALKNVYESYGKTRLSSVKNINMKKAPFMREILRKLEV